MGIADQQPLKDLPRDLVKQIKADPHLCLHLGKRYLSSIADYDVIVKSPGIPVTLPQYREALAAGKEITSQTDVFFAEFTGTIIGVTGTKGKSTTASLLYAILQKHFPNARLVGNIGVPPLDLLREATGDRKQGTEKTDRGSASESIVVYELSSHQLEGLQQSPHIAILLNIVPEHLDYYENFEQYVAAKENITRFQSASDFLIYDSDHDIPRQIASSSKARKIACSFEQSGTPGCFVSGDSIIFRPASGEEEKIVSTSCVRLPGRFNLINVMAAVAAARVAGVPPETAAEAVRNFQPLEHRLEPVGTYGGITFYNDSIATIPEAAIAALDTLGEDVETILLGGTDRGLNFSGLAERLLRSRVKTVLLFRPSGERISRALCEHGGKASALPQQFFVQNMEQAVELAKRHTSQGKICLLSPASPSFGLFRDYRERGEAFKKLVREE